MTNKQNRKPKTRKEMANELNISYSTFWRLMKKLEIELPSGMIYPAKQMEIYKYLYSERG